MIRLSIAVIMIASAFLPAKASDRLRIADALGVLSCLRSLDGYQEVANVAGNNQIITTAYKFKNAALRWAIAKNIAALSQIETSTGSARTQIIRELGGGRGQIEPGTAAALEFTKQWEEILNRPAEVSLQRIKLVELKLDINEIPPTALAGCHPIIDP